MARVFFFAGYFSSRDLNPWFLSDLSYMPLAWLEPISALKLTNLWQIALLVCSLFIPFAPPKGSCPASSWASSSFTTRK